jgi:hypothetical protein
MLLSRCPSMAALVKLYRQGNSSCALGLHWHHVWLKFAPGILPKTQAYTALGVTARVHKAFLSFFWICLIFLIFLLTWRELAWVSWSVRRGRARLCEYVWIALSDSGLIRRERSRARKKRKEKKSKEKQSKERKEKKRKEKQKKKSLARPPGLLGQNFCCCCYNEQH